MRNNAIERLLYLFLLTHLIGWTLVSASVRSNLPLDAIEGAIWGHQLEWGYDKNPFLNGWLTALATNLGGQSGWMIYLFSQLSVVTALFCTWLIAKRMLPPVYALLSVLILESIQYYNFHAIDFNDNTLELGLWGLATYFFYRALSVRPNQLDWILTGFFLALGMMTKYYTLTLIAAMGLFLLCDRIHRQQLKTLAPWLGLGIFLITILPHAFWLYSHDFITVKYVFVRGTGAANHNNHLFFPAQFAWQQFQVFLPAIVLSLLLLIGKSPILSSERTALSHFNRQFLFYIGLGPFLLTLLISSLLNVKLRAGWGMPLQSLWGVILISLIQPAITRAKLHRFYFYIMLLLSIMLSAYAYSLIYSKDTSTANFPGKEVAALITQKWHDRYHTPLHYLAGSRWAGGNVAFYSKDHPSVLIEWNQERAPWVNISDMQKQGAIFIWDITGKETLPNDIYQRFPTLSKAEVIEYNWKFNHYNLEPGKIGIAFLPPIASI